MVNRRLRERELMKRLRSGFTLIELMVVVAIIAIIASIALPSYQNTVTKVRRGDAEDMMELFRQAMERHYSKHYNYLDAAENGDIGVPRIFHQYSPSNGQNKYYQLEISRAGLDCFELKATPLAGSAQQNEPCGILYLDHAGRRGSANNTGICWNGAVEYQLLGGCG